MVLLYIWPKNSSSGGLWTFSNYCKPKLYKKQQLQNPTGNPRNTRYTGTAASTEGTEVLNLLTNIQTTVNAGNLTGQDTETTPVITWASMHYKVPHRTSQDAKAEIANPLYTPCKSIQDFVFPMKHYVTEIVQLMVDAISYDMAFNTNYRSVTAGNPTIE